MELLIAAAMFLCMVWWSLKKSDEPFRLIARWAVTFLMLGGMYKIALPMILRGGQIEVIVGVLIVAACAIVISIAWAANWAAMFVSPLTSALDGGNIEVEPAAIYSAAEAKRSRGQYDEAIAEARKQLVAFPNDYKGLLLIAEIQALNLKDLDAAQLTINLLSDAYGEVPGQFSSARIAMADWWLKHGRINGARENLRIVVDQFPNTSYSQLASQRIAHLEAAQETVDQRSRSVVLQKNYAQDIGLQKKVLSRDVNDPSVLAGEYVAHLQLHPFDNDARQKLAVLYAEQFQRLDLAELEFEQLITQPNQSPKQQAHAISLLADCQVKAGQGNAAAKTIQRIIDMFPNTALAEMAATRLAYLSTELKGKEKSQATVKLGSYRKDLGLKGNY